MKQVVVYTWVCTPVNEELLPVPRTTTGGHVCPVCGLVSEKMQHGAWDSDGRTRASNGIDVIGAPSYDICPCCETQFGLDDMGMFDATVQGSWRLLRQAWLAKTRFSKEAIEQIRNIPELTQSHDFVRT